MKMIFSQKMQNFKILKKFSFLTFINQLIENKNTHIHKISVYIYEFDIIDRSINNFIFDSCFMLNQVN